MKSRNLFTGIIVLFIGIVALLASLDVIDFSWSILFRLWPMLLILLGIAILPIKDWLKAVLLVVALAVSALLYHNEAKNHADRYFWSNWRNRLFSSWNWSDDDDDDIDKGKDNKADADGPFIQQFSEPFHTYQTAKLDIDFGAGKLKIKKPSAELVNVKSDSDFMKYNFRTEKTDEYANVFISGDGKSNNLKGKINNELEVALSDYPLWTVNVETGASNCDIDLSPYKVEKIDISAGACRLNLQLGDKDCDCEVTLKSGVSDIDIELPKTMGCKIISNSALTSKTFKGFEQIEKGLFQTSDFGQTDHNIIIHLDCGASKVEIERK